MQSEKKCMFRIHHVYDVALGASFGVSRVTRQFATPVSLILAFKLIFLAPLSAMGYNKLFEVFLNALSSSRLRSSCFPISTTLTIVPSLPFTLFSYCSYFVQLFKIFPKQILFVREIPKIGGNFHVKFKPVYTNDRHAIFSIF